jgi:SAM-dependent methyltransferase
MPTSDHNNINSILTIVTNLRPRRLLDIGCGFGKYGVLLREYLDIWNERIESPSWNFKLTGIEAFGPYRNPIHDYVYDAVHFCEAQQILPTMGEFDVVLIADVIEHLEMENARELVSECLRHSPVVVISTPTEFYPQQALCDNPYEIHRNLFTKRDFPPDVHVHCQRMVSCNIYVASREPLNPSVFALSDPADYVYLRSRMKLGKWGLPLSVCLKLLCRLAA